MGGVFSIVGNQTQEVIGKLGNQTQEVFDKFNNKVYDKPPNVHEWFSYNEILYILASIEAMVSTVAVIILAAIHLYFVMKYVTHTSLQSGLYWIVFLCPIVSLCGCIGLLIPRTGAFLYSVGLVYLLLCAFMLVSIMTTLYGSRKAMHQKMVENGVRLNPRQSFGCCLWCIPDIKPSAHNLIILEWFIFQSPILRVIIEILSMAVYFELENKDHVFFTIASIISLISMTVASYGSYVLISAGSKNLAQYRFLTMFRIIDTAQFLYTFQMTVMNVLVVMDFFNIKFLTNFFVFGNITASTTIQFWASYFATQEMLIVSCVATYFFRPSKSALFDKYPHHAAGDKIALLPLTNEPSQNPFVCHSALVTSVGTDEEETRARSRQSKANEHGNQTKRKERRTSKSIPDDGNANLVNMKRVSSMKNGSPTSASTQSSTTDREK